MGSVELMVIAGLGLAALVTVVLVSALIRRREGAQSSAFGSGSEDQRPTLDGEAMQKIMGLIRSRQKIEAIKMFRERTGASLADAKQAVEALERNLNTPGGLSGLNAPHEVDARTLDNVRELVRTNKLIEAIKLYRETTGLGLKEAKDAVDEIKRNM